MSEKIINHVFLDIDGVLSDLEAQIAGKNSDKDKWRNIYFPEFLNAKKFETLPLLPDANMLLRFLRKSEVPVTLLTSAGKLWGNDYENIKKQKEVWLKKHNIDWPCVVVHQKEDKKNYAHKHALLIDDTKSNCEDFKDAGGRSIHHHNAIKTINKINKKYILERGE